jgi:hypothetical protein
MTGKLIWELLDKDGNVIERREQEIPIVTDGISACINILFGGKNETVREPS